METIKDLKKRFIEEKNLSATVDDVEVKKTGFGYHVWCIFNGRKYGKFYNL